MIVEDFKEAERRYIATGRDGRRASPRTTMILACTLSPVIGAALGWVGVLTTRGTEHDAFLLREGFTQIAVGGLLLAVPMAVVGWVCYELLGKWYLKNPPFPHVMRFRYSRYRAVFPALVLFFLGLALPLASAVVRSGGDLVDVMVPPQWK